MTENLSILGSTGSIGTQTLDVARSLNIPVSALTASTNVKAVEEQVREFKPRLAVMFNEEAAKDLKTRLSDTNTVVEYGMEGLIHAATISEADTVLTSVVGMVGLKPTLAAINAKKNIALANKETLVTGGQLVMQAVKENGVNLYPVDSEHSAIFQCLQGMNDKKELKKIILTASGGPFFGKKKSELENVTLEQALNHPNWSMGKKITIDSSTMMNKGLEVIEAKWLFDIDVDNIDVVVHRESIIHSMVEFTDNSVIAQMGVPDMRIPIQYAITYPQRVPSSVKPLSLTDIGTLTFAKPDYDTFTCLSQCIRAIKEGQLSPVAANGANEMAVELFLNNKIKFLQIGELVEQAIDNVSKSELTCVEDIINADKTAREFVLSKALG
ncbi:MAG: 1-deoxy-D-xylulose-5-phosphate reductoisomerase [Acutalibacteraceae bacterium]|nr:1-deoxy-D-xylulose-5-phosphate reductoisomerase [Acutalibacteraceae bacterium]